MNSAFTDAYDPQGPSDYARERATISAEARAALIGDIIRGHLRQCVDLIDEAIRLAFDEAALGLVPEDLAAALDAAGVATDYMRRVRARHAAPVQFSEV
jgi:hypothetical protein